MGAIWVWFKGEAMNPDTLPWMLVVLAVSPPFLVAVAAFLGRAWVLDRIAEEAAARTSQEKSLKTRRAQDDHDFEGKVQGVLVKYADLTLKR